MSRILNTISQFNETFQSQPDPQRPSAAASQDKAQLDEKSIRHKS